MAFEDYEDYYLPADLENTDWLTELLNPRKRERRAAIMHHTGGSSLESAQATLWGRGLLGYDYFIAPDGTLIRNPNIPEGGTGHHMKPGWGAKGRGLSNQNTLGIAAIAPDESAVTPKQAEAMRAFAQVRGYGPESTFGHGEVNPGHKSAGEGMSAVNLVRGNRPGISLTTLEGDDQFTGRSTIRGEESTNLPQYGGNTRMNGDGYPGLMDTLAPRQQQGGLLGMLQNPMAQAHLARMLKGLSPYSDLDPDRMMAQAQQAQLAQQQQLRDARDFQFRQQEAERQKEQFGMTHGLSRERFQSEEAQRGLTDISRDIIQSTGFAPGTPEYQAEYKRRLEEEYALKRRTGASFTMDDISKAIINEGIAAPGTPAFQAEYTKRSQEKRAASERMPAEQTARIALANSFLREAPRLRKRIEAGEYSGSVSGELGAMTGMGVGGAEIRRKIDSGADAIIRHLTGAGMALDEAKDYARRYRFSITDNKETALSKLTQLEEELFAINEGVAQGRSAEFVKSLVQRSDRDEEGGKPEKGQKGEKGQRPKITPEQATEELRRRGKL